MTATTRNLALRHDPRCAPYVHARYGTSGLGRVCVCDLIALVADDEREPLRNLTAWLLEERQAYLDDGRPYAEEVLRSVLDRVHPEWRTHAVFDDPDYPPLLSESTPA